MVIGLPDEEVVPAVVRRAAAPAASRGGVAGVPGIAGDGVGEGQSWIAASPVAGRATVAAACPPGRLGVGRWGGCDVRVEAEVGEGGVTNGWMNCPGSRLAM